MTFPAFSVESELMSISIIRHKFTVGKEFRVASDAVFVNHFPPSLMDKDNLRLKPESKHRSMSEAILRLEEVLIKHIIMGYMTVVTVGLFAVRAMVPGGILGSHYVAVYTSLRFVAKV